MNFRVLASISAGCFAVTIACWVTAAILSGSFTTWLSPIVALIAMLVSAGSFVQSRRSADAAQRNAKVVELQEGRRRFGWSVTVDPEGERYVLRNVGTIAATEVALSGYRHVYFTDRSDAPTIAPGEAKAFVVLQGFDEPVSELRIDWIPEGLGHRRSWVEVLPEMESRFFADAKAESKAARIRNAETDRQTRLRHVELLIELADVYSQYRECPTDRALKLHVQALVAALPPHMVREIGYQVDVPRHAWGPSEWPLSQSVGDDDKALVEDAAAEIELLWNIQQTMGWSFYLADGGPGGNTEPRIWWAVQGYVRRVRARERGERKTRRSPEDQRNADEAAQRFAEMEERMQDRDATEAALPGTAVDVTPGDAILGEQTNEDRP